MAPMTIKGLKLCFTQEPVLPGPAYGPGNRMVYLTSFTCNVSETGLLDCAKQWNHVSIGCSHSQDFGGVISDPQLCKCKLGFAAHVDSFLGGILGWGGVGGGGVVPFRPLFSNFHTTHTIESIQQLYVCLLKCETHDSHAARCFISDMTVSAFVQIIRIRPTLSVSYYCHTLSTCTKGL